MNRFSYKIEHKLRPTKETKRVMMFIMARITSCTTLEEVDQLFTSLCISCLSRMRYPEVEQYIKKLENAIFHCNENHELGMDYLSEIDEELSNELGDCMTYRNKSPFGKHFDSILQKSKSFVQDLQTRPQTISLEVNHRYYLPDLPGFLVTHYMPICPLWTGVIIGPTLFPGKLDVTFTNSIVENWIKIVKHTILKDEIKLRPGDFIRRIYEGLCGRIKAFDFGFLQISSKLLKRTKINREKDNTQFEEIWERRKRKRSYFKQCQLSKTKFNEISTKQKNLTFKPKRKKKIRRGKPIKKVQISEINSNDVQSDDSIFDLVKNSSDVIFHDQGQFSPVTSDWQRQKCKEFMFTYVSGVIYENEAFDKSLEIRKLAPSKEKRVSPDGNCLFSSLSYVVTGSDHYHREFRELLIKNMKNKYRTECTNYCTSHCDLLPEQQCNTIEEYISVSMMDRVGSWGTDLELFLAAQLLQTDIFVFKDVLRCWNKFSGYGFNGKQNVHDLTEKRLYLRLYFSHFQPVTKVNTVKNVMTESYVEEFDPIQ